MQQVFTPEAPIDLDSSPLMLAGCSHSSFCSVFTFTSIIRLPSGMGRAEYWRASNGALEADDKVGDQLQSTEYVLADLRGNLQNSNAATGAWWSEQTHITAVPEPETYALMLAGLGLLRTVARSRKAKQA